MIFPKSIKLVSLGPILSSRHAVTYKVTNKLTSIIRPLVAIPHHIRNTQHFMDHVKSIQLQQGECIVYYDNASSLLCIHINMTDVLLKQSIITIYSQTGFHCLHNKAISSGLCENVKPYKNNMCTDKRWCH